MTTGWLRIAVVSLLATGCVVAIGGEDEENEGRMQVLTDVTFDQAWEAAIDTFEELQLPIDNLERASGVVTTDWILLEDAGDYMNCPDDATRNAEGRFNIFLREVGDGIRVTVNASFRAEDDSGRRLTCESEGAYEELVLRRIRSKVD